MMSFGGLHMKLLASFLLLLLAATAALADSDLQIQHAWVRATVPGQMASGAFMRVTSPTDQRLISVQSPLGIAQIHQMSIDQGVMRMKALPQGLPLPAGQAIDLKPGGYHIMLLDLKTALSPGQKVPLTLQIQDPSGRQKSVALEVPILKEAPPGGPTSAAAGTHRHP